MEQSLKYAIEDDIARTRGGRKEKGYDKKKKGQDSDSYSGSDSGGSDGYFTGATKNSVCIRG